MKQNVKFWLKTKIPKSIYKRLDSLLNKANLKMVKKLDNRYIVIYNTINKEICNISILYFTDDYDYCILSFSESIPDEHMQRFIDKSKVFKIFGDLLEIDMVD